MNLPNLRTLKGAAIAVCAAILGVVAAAFAIPPGVAGGDTAAAGPGGFAQGVAAAEPEDLSGFIASDRWGVSLSDVLEEIAARDQTRGGLNPVLRRMGFLGLIEAGDDIHVLLADPELDGGDIIELSPGDTLPDGRVLTSVTGNSITLSRHPEGAGGGAGGAEREVLLLFPRGEPEPPDGRDSQRTQGSLPRQVDAHPVSARFETLNMGRKVVGIGIYCGLYAA